MMPKEHDSEMVVRVVLSGVSILVGTSLWFVGATLFNTIDGEPGDSRVLAPGNVLFFITPPVVALLYVYLGREFRISSWIFTIFCCYWAVTAFKIFWSGDFSCTWWHQGDLLCHSNDDLFIQLWAADLIFILVVTILARWFTRNIMLAILSIIIFLWVVASAIVFVA